MTITTYVVTGVSLLLLTVGWAFIPSNEEKQRRFEESEFYKRQYRPTFRPEVMKEYLRLRKEEMAAKDAPTADAQ